MDKLIRTITKDVKHHNNAKAEKELKHLEKADKKRDHVVAEGKMYEKEHKSKHPSKKKHHKS